MKFKYEVQIITKVQWSSSIKVTTVILNIPEISPTYESACNS